MDTLLGQITPQWKLIDGPLQESAIAQMLAQKMRRDKILGEYKYHRVDLGDAFTVESYASGAAVGGSETEAYLDLPIVYAKLAIPFDINEDILDELEAAGSQDGVRTLAYRKMQWVKRANLELVRQIMGTCDTPGALCEVTSVAAGVATLKNCPDILANSFLNKKVQFDLVNKTTGAILTKDGGGSATGYVAYCIKKTDGAHVIGLGSSVALAAAGTVDATLTISDVTSAVLCYPDMYSSVSSVYTEKSTDNLLRLLKYHTAARSTYIPAIPAITIPGCSPDISLDQAT